MATLALITVAGMTVIMLFATGVAHAGPYEPQGFTPTTIRR